MSSDSALLGVDAPLRRQKRSIATLAPRHRVILVRAINNVLSTSIAQSTLAQVVDGLPTSDVERDKSDSSSISYEHPLHKRHRALCPGALEKLQHLKETFELESLEFEAELLFEFNGLSVRSQLFKTKFIELVARAIHQLAVILHQSSGAGFHEHDDLASWAPSKDDTIFWEDYPNGPPATLFIHQWYIDYDLYPEGVSDGVGYWAEARILGGVVLFDRRDVSKLPNSNPHAIYYHTDRDGITYRIYALIDSQKQSLVEFLLAEENEPTPCPLPILGNNENRTRVDPEEPILKTGIYRDPWERKLRSTDTDRRRIRRDIMDRLNYTSWADFNESIARGGNAEREWFRNHPDEV